MSSFVQIKNLSKRFPSQSQAALDHVSANIPKGKIVGLVGPDGAGKTTLIRLMAALLKPSEGQITINGHDTMAYSEYVHEMTGYMPQKFGLYEDLTVLQNLTLYADLRNVIGKERTKGFDQLLKFTNLEDFQQRLAGALSGGMKQKLGLACALINKPELLLLDEPSVGVDPISRRELWKIVYTLIEQGISVVWSTAYLDEAERCDTVLLLNEGKLLFSGLAQELANQIEGHVFLVHTDSENRRKLLRQILSQENVTDGVIQGREIRVVVKNPPFKYRSLLVEKIAPRFEDAFVNILGGGPGGESKLADRHAQIVEKREIVVKAENLTKVYGQFIAANSVNFVVRKGEVFGLLGPNGAGKSTTFRMVCGLIRPTSGHAWINGLNLEKAPSQARAQIGYMAQKFSLYTNLNVLQNLEFFSGIYNLQGESRKKAIEEMVEIFELKKYLQTPTDLLPLGFKQRLSLACATMHNPSILFLDEPTSGVDPITRREFWNHINGLVEKGVTIMVTTHFMDEAEYCDHVALLYKGQVINMAPPDELKKMCQTKKHPNPSLEDAFIHLIEEFDVSKS